MTLTFTLDIIVTVWRRVWVTLLLPAFARESRESSTKSTLTTFHFISTAREYNKILACGTVRQGWKGSPPVLYDKDKTKAMKRGEAFWRMKGPILALTWLDNTPVTISGMITVIPQEQVPEVQRRKNDGTLEHVACPPIISSYNCYTGGVDKNDQMKSSYGINVSGKKWWTRVFFDLIDRAIFNSKVLYDESLHTTRKSLKDFKVDLSKLLVGSFCFQQKHGRSSLDVPQAKFVERHFPASQPANDKGRRMERRCVICSAAKIKKKTSYHCPDCDVGLCATPCFHMFGRC